MSYGSAEIVLFDLIDTLVVFWRHAGLFAESRPGTLFQFLLLPQDSSQIRNARLARKGLMWSLRWRTHAIYALIFSEIDIHIWSGDMFLLLGRLLVPRALVCHHWCDTHLDILLLYADVVDGIWDVFGRLVLFQILTFLLDGFISTSVFLRSLIGRRLVSELLAIEFVSQVVWARWMQGQHITLLNTAGHFLLLWRRATGINMLRFHCFYGWLVCPRSLVVLIAGSVS